MATQKNKYLGINKVVTNKEIKYFDKNSLPLFRAGVPQSIDKRIKISTKKIPKKQYKKWILERRVFDIGIRKINEIDKIVNKILKSDKK